jgi:release factor glutamine methyltransferase
MHDHAAGTVLQRVMQPMNATESQHIGPAGLELFARLRGRLEQALQTLPDKPEETSDSTLRCLWHLASGAPMSPDAAIEAPLTPLAPDMQASLKRLVEQRISGVPLAHLSGRQRFMGLELLASAQALIPRRETELLARAAIDTLRHEILAERGQATAIDACTGCGNLAVAMAHADQRVQVLASDLSADAVDLARRNVDHLALGAQVELRVGDLLQPFDEPRFHRAVDIITCNPPYISTKKMETMPSEIIGFEPRLAFDGGALGVRILQRLIREAPRLLREGGWLLFEVGLGQGPAVMQRMSGIGGYARIDSVVDHEGQIRAVTARCV